MLGLLRIEIKHVNCKTCVHQISEIGLMKQVRVWSHVVASVWGCRVVDRRCRGSKGKVKIEGHMRVSDEEAHYRWLQGIRYLIACILLPPPR